MLKRFICDNKFSIFLFFLLISINSYSQTNNKYSKWQNGSFKGYNILYESIHTLQDFIDFKNYGGNLFQIGTFGWMNEDPPYSVQQANIDSTNRFVNYCRQAGIYYVIAIRSGPGAYDTYQESQGNTPESRIWNTGNNTEQELYANMVKNIVTKFSSDTLFAGINLVVEPRPMVTRIPANTSTSYKFFLETVYNVHMDRVYSTFINNIRSVDSQIPIIIENFAYSTPELFPGYIINDPFIVYSTHDYMPKEYTNANIEYTSAYPGTFWNISFLAQKYYNAQFLRNTILKNVRDFQNLTNAPIFIGEFGIMYPQHGASEYLNDILSIAKEYSWNWAIWDWRRGSGKKWNIESFGIDTSSTSVKPFDVVLSYFKSIPNSTKYALEKKSLNEFSLSENYPNPFNPQTVINFNIPTACNVNLYVYDILGREIRTLINDNKEKGNYSVQFDGTNISSGIYFYKLSAVSLNGKENFHSIKRMILIK